MKLKVQIGVEAKAPLPLRLTPIDQTLPDLPDWFENFLLELIKGLDKKDSQPDDGEYDFKLTEPMKKALALNKDFAAFLPADANAFLRVKAV